jgi:hypothetical protein
MLIPVLLPTQTTCRSVSGMVFTLAGVAIARKMKKHTITATSLTDAELLAAVQAAKSAKY